MHVNGQLKTVWSRLIYESSHVDIKATTCQSINVEHGPSCNWIRAKRIDNSDVSGGGALMVVVTLLLETLD